MEREEERFRLEHGTGRRGLLRDAMERSRGRPDRGSRLRWCEASVSGSPYAFFTENRHHRLFSLFSSFRHPGARNFRVSYKKIICELGPPGVAGYSPLSPESDSEDGQQRHLDVGRARVALLIDGVGREARAWRREMLSASHAAAGGWLSLSTLGAARRRATSARRNIVSSL